MPEPYDRFQRPTDPAPPLSERATLVEPHEERAGRAPDLLEGVDQGQLLRELQAMYFDTGV